MIEISGHFITGVMCGIEFIGPVDLGDQSVHFGIVIDLAIVRLQITFYKDPFKPA